MADPFGKYIIFYNGTIDEDTIVIGENNFWAVGIKVNAEQVKEHHLFPSLLYAFDLPQLVFYAALQDDLIFEAPLCSIQSLIRALLSSSHWLIYSR